MKASEAGFGSIDVKHNFIQKYSINRESCGSDYGSIVDFIYHLSESELKEIGTISSIDYYLSIASKKASIEEAMNYLKDIKESNEHINSLVLDSSETL